MMESIWLAWGQVREAVHGWLYLHRTIAITNRLEPGGVPQVTSVRCLDCGKCFYYRRTFN